MIRARVAVSQLTGVLTLLAVIYLRPGIAHAVVEGTTPAPFDSHRVFGDGVSIGNTLMENPPPNLQVNSELLSTVAAGSRVFWQVDVMLPEGRTVSSQTFVVQVQ